MIGRMGYPLQPSKGSIWQEFWPSSRSLLLSGGLGADITEVKLRASTLDRIAAAYAEAVAIGDFESAEGWLATASFVAEREAERTAKPDHRSRVLVRSRRRSHG
jgi:hypothetical protein